LRIARFLENGTPVFGLVEGESVRRVEGDLLNSPKAGEVVGSLHDLKLAAPCTPTKVVAIGLNYLEHIKESGLPRPEEPLFFLKPPSAVLEPEGVIKYPRQSKRVDYEAELAVVIGKRAKNVSEAEARNCILGYTCGNDVTARDLQHSDGQWIRGKGFDTFCPLGPVIVTDISPADLRVQSRLNGKVMQDGRTSDMLFGVDYLVSFVSRVMTLEPFDVIMTGTPCGVASMKLDDVIEVEVEGIGILRNTIGK
jgi:2-keto-4-pentenoate hydratase/2-oxohepta-3-ene-1,7-dioic acid hydratase in catechol pathway